MSDKYPYIGEGKRSGNAVLFSGKGLGVVIREGESVTDNFKVGVKSSAWKEGLFENITREYLTNIYGKCESQEHADFICKLAGNEGFRTINDYSEKTQWFCFNNNLVEFYSEEGAAHHGEKLIHLPLPPKENEMTEVKEQKPIYTKEMHERGEFEIGMIYLNDDSQKCELVGINHNQFIGNIIEIPTKQYHLDISLIEYCKPITTIEDEMNKILSNHYDNGGMDEDLIKKFLEKYNITPKGGK